MKIQLISKSVKRKGLAEVVVHDSYVNKSGRKVNTSQTRHVRIERDGAYSFTNENDDTEVLVPSVVPQGDDT